GPVIVPNAFWQVDQALRHVGLDDWGGKQIVSDHELVVEIVCIRIVLIVEHQRPKKWSAVAVRFFQRGVKKWQQLVSQFQIPANNVFIVFSKTPGLLIVTVDGVVIAKEGREKTNLIRAHEEFAIGAPGETADVAANKRF